MMMAICRLIRNENIMAKVTSNLKVGGCQMRNNTGVGLVELVLILMVLIILFSLFRDPAVDFVQRLFEQIVGK